MTNHYSGAMRELSYQEIDLVSGGDAQGAADAANIAAGALGVVAAGAGVAALVPSPFSPVLGAFAGAAGVAAAGFAFIGTVVAAGADMPNDRKGSHVRLN